MENNAKITARELAVGAKRLSEAMTAVGTTAEEAGNNIEAALKAMQEAEQEDPAREGFPHPPRSLLSSRPAPPRTIRPTARTHLKQHNRKRAEPDAAGR